MINGTVRIEYNDKREFFLVVGQYTPIKDMDGEREMFHELARVSIQNFEIRQKIEKHEDTEDERIVHEEVVESIGLIQVDLMKVEIVKVENA